jgi:hypothetical protein
MKIFSCLLFCERVIFQSAVLFVGKSWRSIAWSIRNPRKTVLIWAVLSEKRRRRQRQKKARCFLKRLSDKPRRLLAVGLEQVICERRDFGWLVREPVAVLTRSLTSSSITPFPRSPWPKKTHPTSRNLEVTGGKPGNDVGVILTVWGCSPVSKKTKNEWKPFCTP